MELDLEKMGRAVRDYLQDKGMYDFCAGALDAEMGRAALAAMIPALGPGGACPEDCPFCYDCAYGCTIDLALCTARSAGKQLPGPSCPAGKGGGT